MNAFVEKPRRWKLGFCALLLSGCASVPPPIEQMTSAKSAVADAVGVQAAELAPVEMKLAQLKLNEANIAMAAKEYARARRLSEQAELDAVLAGTKARSAKAQRDVAELEQSVRTLQGEINRRAP